jgi:hypothetical protein
VHGPIHRLLALDHERLDALLTRAAADAARIDFVAYHEFRVGILRHIGIEEKILLPTASERGGAPLPVAARLKSDHATLATLLVPTPTHEIVAGIRRVLVAHNPLEEDEGGMYDAVDRLLGRAESAAVLERIRLAPPPPVMPYRDTPRILERIERVLREAGAPR